MILKNISYTIPRDQVLLRLKYNVERSVVPPTIERLINSMMEEGRIVADPAAIVHEYAIERSSAENVVLHDTKLVLTGEAIAKHLSGCFQVSVLVCTIGAAYAEAIECFMHEKEIAKAAILDAVCSEAVEAVADSVSAIIVQQARAASAKVTARFSPGYGDWPLAAQRDILTVLGSHEIGVQLNERNLMIPEKSITAVIGWFK